MTKHSKKAEAPSEIELMPDSWERFERAAGVVAKTPLQHRVAKKTAAKKTKRLKLERVFDYAVDRSGACLQCPSTMLRRAWSQ